MEFQKLVQIAIENGGMSYNPATDELNPSTGYMVSLDGYEVKSPELTDELLKKYYLGKMLLAYANLPEGSEIYLGLWKDDQWYFDVSVKINDFEEATRLAKLFNQKAFFSNATKESIFVA